MTMLNIYLLTDLLEYLNSGLNLLFQITMNMERFTGLNFRIFTVFKSTVKVYLWIYMHLFYNKHFWPKQHKNISVKTSMGLKLRIFSPANISMYTVVYFLYCETPQRKYWKYWLIYTFWCVNFLYCMHKINEISWGYSYLHLRHTRAMKSGWAL